MSAAFSTRQHSPMTPYPPDDFLLQSRTARRLYFEYAGRMPVFDYHNHLSAHEIRENRHFENITRVWLSGDHYKWRAMRAMGIDEELISGSASDREKFRAWAAVVPCTVRNPLYAWTHMELKQFFGLSDLLLSRETADAIFDHCSEALTEERLTPRGILQHLSVETACTTNDPLEDLTDHQVLNEDSTFNTCVRPTFRPDCALQTADPGAFNRWLEGLEKTTGLDIKGVADLLAALENRIRYFHDCGCRLADHSFETISPCQATAGELDRVLAEARAGKPPTPEKASSFANTLLRELGRLYADLNWTWQLHIGALRNVNTRMYALVGSDGGFDAMGDSGYAVPLSGLLDDLDRNQQLPRTILYPLNPNDFEMLAALAGCFQSGPEPGKIQLGPAWWFNDHRDGIERQLSVLSNLGLISRFIGMLTDSRSFLSFSRHDYFRRILCNLFGSDVERGELPDDTALLGGIIQDICYHNAQRYFNMT